MDTKKKKRILSITLVVSLAVVLSFVINSYVREIQTKIHEGIGYVWENVNPGLGEFLYDTNGILFNGKGFDSERDIKHTINETFKSIVSIKLLPTEDSFVQNLGGQGTGFFIKVDDEFGYIATNFHVIERAIVLKKNIKLQVNTATDWWDYEAEVIGMDPVADVAVIRIRKIDNEEWEALEFVEDSSLEVAEGDPVVVIGHGMSLPYTATTGHVSYTNRFGTGIYTLHLQIDAVINQGNSGGPVISTDRKVVGIVVSILSPGRQIPGWDGVGLAVTSEISQRAIDYIFENYEGETVPWVPYSEMPYSFKTFTYEELKENGQLELDKKDRNMLYAHMEEKYHEGSAYKAGLRSGDIILELNGEKVYSPFQMIMAAILSMPGDEFTFKVKRGDEELEFTFTLPEKSEKEMRSWLSQRAKAQQSMSLFDEKEHLKVMGNNCASCHSVPNTNLYPYN